jgi:hypothetical protein
LGQEKISFADFLAVSMRGAASLGFDRVANSFAGALPGSELFA